MTQRALTFDNQVLKFSLPAKFRSTPCLHSPITRFEPGPVIPPPYLAGRDSEKDEYRKLLTQSAVTDNCILTGLRGVGKTVLLEEFKRIAIEAGWLWCAGDLSEAVSLSEEKLALRIITDLAVVTSSITVSLSSRRKIGFVAKAEESVQTLTYQLLLHIFEQAPGVTLDKLKAIFEFVFPLIPSDKRGLVISFDEAQNLTDHPSNGSYPLGMLLDFMQSIQKRGTRLFVTLVGLPTLFPKFVASRTFAERMFHTITLGKLTDADGKAAVVEPIKSSQSSLGFSDKLVKNIVKESGGYPYFIQFIAREVYDLALQKQKKREPLTVSLEDISRKLDDDFFVGQWSHASERQRELLKVIASLEHCDDEYTIADIVAESERLHRDGKLSEPFKSSPINQMLSTLQEKGFVYKNRRGQYSFAVPLLGRFIRRQGWD